MVNYLVLGTSAYTYKQFKDYRSLEAYNQCVNGWVQEAAGCILSDKYVVVGKPVKTLYMDGVQCKHYCCA